MLAARTAITRVGEDVEVVLKQERDPLPPRHGVRVTGTYLTPSAVGAGNSLRARAECDEARKAGRGDLFAEKRSPPSPSTSPAV